MPRILNDTRQRVVRRTSDIQNLQTVLSPNRVITITQVFDTKLLMVPTVTWILDDVSHWLVVPTQHIQTQPTVHGPDRVVTITQVLNEEPLMIPAVAWILDEFRKWIAGPTQHIQALPAMLSYKSNDPTNRTQIGDRLVAVRELCFVTQEL
ncbi:hypothetical protein CYFUS_006597 [Cystobacter fuscus]|uniref:Uncharacterized protein n=1 Tax=Cystobacter fuscus TaxID=43 RepID=A0A250JB56_9BACT|nr:hypothetical protein CYFUS_006597 [Cystobacter fuscus]